MATKVDWGYTSLFVLQAGIAATELSLSLQLDVLMVHGPSI